MNTNHKGNAAELAIAAEAAKLGLSVLKPLTEHERYDLVLGIGGSLYRVQCKWGTRAGGIVKVKLSSSSHSPTRGYVTTTYDRAEIDLIAVHCEELNRRYLLPIELFENRRNVHLRLDEALNNQQAALNWAAHYEFPGAVAQLAERSDGIRKVRGSIPLSSTAENADPASAVVVGAHEFRNRFGYYLERASQGQEIGILRRGKPFARLCPPS